MLAFSNLEISLLELTIKTHNHLQNFSAYFNECPVLIFTDFIVDLLTILAQSLKAKA